ncbi:uncharacterized protein TRIVIDRAFT_64034 [Trichoderma virens Gv29-8]|uniref:Uncharacterized protein n=1 Tax=Hypocrea virens (strain Gv29-8 / FGSC 10586) TaxID=413071 RepID=G9MNS7_HYPVG|nr:uncharacterized protein TRIVIDRAFT_64034 [Trichoderma virens Gv29-8]EHK23530.1 hypothetical protein TRIVIDRAFT_64034 [Trichoderma virens Gv29-8]
MHPSVNGKSSAERLRAKDTVWKLVIVRKPQGLAPDRDADCLTQGCQWRKRDAHLIGSHAQADDGFGILGALDHMTGIRRCFNAHREVASKSKVGVCESTQRRAGSREVVQAQPASRIKLVPRADPGLLFGRCQPKTKIYTLQTLRPASPQANGWLGPQVEMAAKELRTLPSRDHAGTRPARSKRGESWQLRVRYSSSPRASLDLTLLTQIVYMSLTLDGSPLFWNRANCKYYTVLRTGHQVDGSGACQCLISLPGTDDKPAATLVLALLGSKVARQSVARRGCSTLLLRPVSGGQYISDDGFNR